MTQTTRRIEAIRYPGDRPWLALISGCGPRDGLQRYFVPAASSEADRVSWEVEPGLYQRGGGSKQQDGYLLVWQGPTGPMLTRTTHARATAIALHMDRASFELRMVPGAAYEAARVATRPVAAQ